MDLCGVKSQFPGWGPVWPFGILSVGSRGLTCTQGCKGHATLLNVGDTLGVGPHLPGFINRCLCLQDRQDGRGLGLPSPSLLVPAHIAPRVGHLLL